MQADVLVICEAQADFVIGIGLARRVAQELPLAADLRPCGFDPEEGFSRWNSVRARFDRWREEREKRDGSRLRRFALRSEGFAGGDAETAWQVSAMLAMRLPGASAAILLVRDTDNDLRRAEGLRSAVERLAARGNRIVLALAHPKREAWVLNGFVPANRHETAALKRVVSKLGFDPVRQSHRLNAKGRSGGRNAKIVLDELTGGSRVKEVSCWEETPLAELKKNGKSTGLAAYLADLEPWLRALVDV